jgi:hypothetical protein
MSSAARWPHRNVRPHTLVAQGRIH